MLVLAYRTQPYDLVNDFQAAGDAVLHHHDPILNNRQNGWGSLPVYVFVLAAAAWTSLHLHVSWLIIARIPAILCDVGVVVLVGAVAGAAGERAALRRFQYACNPLAILVSSVHGQLEPACFLFVLAAFLVVLRAGPHVSGLRAIARWHPARPRDSHADMAGGVRPGAAARPAIVAPSYAVRGRSRWNLGAAVRNDAAHGRHAGRQAALHCGASSLRPTPASGPGAGQGYG